MRRYTLKIITLLFMMMILSFSERPIARAIGSDETSATVDRNRDRSKSNADDSVTSSKTRFPVRVGENKRYLIDQYDKPFFYLGDTAWELFHRLDLKDAETYLRDRAGKRFNVIQAVVLAEHGGLDVPNAYGHLPLENKDPRRRVEAYFEHVDRVVAKADELGLTIGMLPTWGSWWHDGAGIFNPESAYDYGLFLGKRYRDRPIIWILGGDRPIENDRHQAIIRATAKGLREGDGGRHLMTFHPPGGAGSANWFHNDDWLAFNMRQTGHGRDHDNYAKIADDYRRIPVKPCIDGEPGYEDHPAEFNPKNGYLTDHDIRKFIYWSTFAGAAGHTYGCHDIWQFLDVSKKPPVTAARTPWRKALDLPGAGQMRFARELIESRPYLDRIPDQSLVVSGPEGREHHIQATRDAKGSFAFIYIPMGDAVVIDLEKLKGKTIQAYWFDPKSGSARRGGTFPRIGRREFVPPVHGAGNDRVLILDDADAGYPPPGTIEN